ncbi:MAG: DNA/RNA nuclease SfsA [Methanomassiliicoccaceae archaeon]|nr:DNA/RNA nuclease SfsA [Methanomassiliicoccaceae archaeon]MCL2146120.1 DNA/RNA nuclease SfsA [Methanomassiliicoccaceae archaeon]
MKYPSTLTGTFIERPNRFIAYVEIDGKKERCHVKNTGRCRELLIPGATAVLSVPDNPDRSTRYDLIGVYKGDMLVNIDSQAPNKVVEESIHRIPGFEDADKVRPEYRYGDSRIDIYAESGGKMKLMEIKGVTLEKNGLALFPDAPTERGLKHVRELEAALKDGYEAYIMFLVQMSGPKVFSPHYEMHEEFASEVERAYGSGVKVLAYDSVVTEDSISLGNPIDVEFAGHS